MGNTGLPRREAEMTLLQPHLGERDAKNSGIRPLAFLLVQVSTCKGGRSLPP